MPKRLDVLIIDDQVKLLETLYDVLEEYGYNVTSVDSGEKGVELIKRKYFDVALVDIQMPGINGVETFREIHRLSPSTAVIMMTAASTEEMIKQTLAEGAFAVVYKPFELSRLTKMISEASRRPIILIVDDRWEDRETLKDILTEKYKVVTAKDGMEALEIVQKSGVNIVLLDVRMPGMDGYATLEVLKKLRPDVGVIMMTGYSIEESVENTLKKDAFTVLNKPFNIEHIFRVIEEIHGTLPKVVGLADVLIVDDDTNLRETLADILSDEGYNVVTAGSGAEAIEKVNEKFFPIVITDFQMSDTTGLELTRKICEIHEDTCVILMTGFASLEMAQNAIKEGVFDYLTKPVDPVGLKKTLVKALEKQRLVLENKRLLEELQNKNRELRKLDELKSKFLSMVTHELRTPLSAIKGYVNFLFKERKGPLNEEQKKMVRIIDNESDHLNGLISDLLDLTRIEAGKMKMEKTDISLVEVIDHVLTRTRPMVEARGIQMETDVAVGLPLVHADSGRIEQVVTNLITNAMKHTPSGGKIGITVHQLDQRVEVAVSDTGEGIPPEELHKIFDRFYQVEDSANKRSGLGLGLAIVREILQMHQGRIVAESEGLGKGCTFKLDLPIVSGVPAENQQK